MYSFQTRSLPRHRLDQQLCVELQAVFVMNVWISLLLLWPLLWHHAYGSVTNSTTTAAPYLEPDLNCDFESGLGSWVAKSTDRRQQWRIEGLTSTAPITGPEGDHTTGSGSYLVRRSQSYRHGSASLESPPIRTAHATCLSLWYHMHGYDVARLTVFRVDTEGLARPLFSEFGPQGNRWYRAVMSPEEGEFKLVIKAIDKVSRGTGDIAIDDISFSYGGSCRIEESELRKHMPLFDCDFETNLCGWSIRKSQVLQWKRESIHENSTNDRYPLPPFTSGTSVAKVEDSREGHSRYPSSTTLLSPTISVNQKNACLSFWYKNNGAVTSHFRVLRFFFGSEPTLEMGRELFSEVSHHLSAWKQVNITLRPGKNFIVGFMVHTTDAGSYALDDIQLTRGGPCVEGPQEALIDCDFDQGFCHWYLQTLKGEFDWQRRQGPTPTNQTGPPRDHTTGAGYYIYLDASAFKEANLFSLLIHVDERGACLTFWTYLFGPDVLELKLFYLRGQQHYRHRFDQAIWSLKGEQEDRWIQHNVSLTLGVRASVSKLFTKHTFLQLQFHASSRYFPRGDIALDDISIAFGAPCGSEISQTTTPFPTQTSPPESSTSEAQFTEAPRLETPKLSVEGKVDPAYNNSRVELVCHAGTPQPEPDAPYLNFNWFWRRNSSVEPKFWAEKWMDNRLVFGEVHPRDAGLYSCSASQHGRPQSLRSNEVRIQVVPDPRPSPLLKAEEFIWRRTEMRPEELMDLKANARLWLTCGDPVEGGEYHWKSTSKAFNSKGLPNTRELYFSSTRAEHSGVYSCRISKDEFMTGKSNEVQLRVIPGKTCNYDWQCEGNGYIRRCKDKRCLCSNRAKVVGGRCQVKPRNPVVYTHPDYTEFSVGESFYVVCKPRDPVTSTVTYEMRHHQYTDTRPLNILKVTNASVQDAGGYQCVVAEYGIKSDSETINVQVKEFQNLDCDFTEDLCGWKNEEEPGLSRFTLTTPGPGDDQDAAMPEHGNAGPFIHLLTNETGTPTTARLRSLTIDEARRNSCLSFWCRMHGPHVHSLSVWLYRQTRAQLPAVRGSQLWIVIGEQGFEWIQHSITIPKGDEISVVFEATGHVALDDVTFVHREGCQTLVPRS